MQFNKLRLQAAPSHGFSTVAQAQKHGANARIPPENTIKPTVRPGARARSPSTGRRRTRSAAEGRNPGLTA